MAQIKSWKTDEVLFEYEGLLKEAVEEAVRQDISLNGANLRYANLEGANLKDADLKYANLYGADLRCANLRNANLRYAIHIDADLRNADLYGADLKCANLRNANLKGAYLRGADLEGADLSGAKLERAELLFADLKGAKLEGADFSDAYLYAADLRFAKFEKAKFQNADVDSAIGVPEDLIPLACPTEGSFVAWKKVGDKLVKLEIPKEAKRSSATSKKCRCSKAKVLAITNLDETVPFEEVFNGNYTPLTYKVGKMVYPDSFDGDRWKECSNGIHFFMNKEDAINW